MRSPRRILVLAALVVVVGASAVLANGCQQQVQLKRKAEAVTGGHVDRGERAFARYGCGACHTVSGVPQAAGLVGPPLDGIAARAIVAGKLENRPAQLRRWIEDPQAVSPGTAMPNLGVTPADSRDIAAFLYTRT